MTTKEFVIKVKKYGEKEIKALYEKCLKIECTNGESFSNNFCDYYLRTVTMKNSYSDSNIYVLLRVGAQNYTTITKDKVLGDSDNISLSIFEMLVDYELEQQEQRYKRKAMYIQHVEEELHEHFKNCFSEEALGKLLPNCILDNFDLQFNVVYRGK